MCVNIDIVKKSCCAHSILKEQQSEKEKQRRLTRNKTEAYAGNGLKERNREKENEIVDKAIK